MRSSLPGRFPSLLCGLTFPAPPAGDLSLVTASGGGEPLTDTTMQDEFIDDQPPVGTLTPEARESLRLAIADTPADHPDKLTP